MLDRNGPYRPLARLWECSQSGVQNNKIVLQKWKFLLFCPPVWLHSHRRARGLLSYCLHRRLRISSYGQQICSLELPGVFALFPLTCMENVPAIYPYSYEKLWPCNPIHQILESNIAGTVPNRPLLLLFLVEQSFWENLAKLLNGLPNEVKDTDKQGQYVGALLFSFKFFSSYTNMRGMIFRSNNNHARQDKARYKYNLYDICVYWVIDW